MSNYHEKRHVTVAGSAAYTELSFSDATQITSFDSTGLLAGGISSSISTAGTVDATVTLGAGSDAFTYSGSADVTIDTGAGADYLDNAGIFNSTVAMGAGDDWYEQDNTGADTDTIVIAAADFTVGNLTNVSGFERLGVVSGSYDASLLGVNAIMAGAITGSFFTLTTNYVAWTGDATVTNLGADTEVLFNDTSWNDNKLTVDLKTDTAADALTVMIGNTAGAVAVGTTNTDGLDAQDYETITINSTGKTGNTLQELVTNDMTKLVVTGDIALTINGMNSTLGIGTTPNLTKIDAHEFTANLTFGEASDATGSVEFLGGTKVDTYLGTANGDVIKAGAGADVITLGALGAADQLVFADGDSKAGAFDNYHTFISGEDTIDLGAFAFTGSAASALAAKGDINAAVAAYDATTTVADFFASGGYDRGVAYSTNAANTYVLVDANHNGDFDGASDMVILLAGTATVALADFGF